MSRMVFICPALATTGESAGRGATDSRTAFAALLVGALFKAARLEKFSAATLGACP